MSSVSVLQLWIENVMKYLIKILLYTTSISFGDTMVVVGSVHPSRAPDRYTINHYKYNKRHQNNENDTFWMVHSSTQCRLNAWARWAVARGPHEERAHCYYINICVLCIKHWFCWMYQYNKYMFNFIDIYSFIPVSSCEVIGPIVMPCPGAYDAVKTALTVL